VDENHIFTQWAANFFESGSRTGRSFDFCVKGEIKKWMEEAGFVDIVHGSGRFPSARGLAMPR
jgi:hypothetical protein